MIKTGYKVVVSYPTGDEMVSCPELVSTTVDDPECVSWREAKKQLRQWYLDQAYRLRKMSEKDFNPSD